MAYIKAVKIENCRNVQSLHVDLSAASDSNRSEQSPIFKHLVFTGPNGSGKSGVLAAIAGCIGNYFTWKREEKKSIYRPSGDFLGNVYLAVHGGAFESGHVFEWLIKDSRFGEWLYLGDWWGEGASLTAYLPARGRRFGQERVSGPKKLDLTLEKNHVKEELSPYFLQFLVNKHTEMIYAKVDSDFKTSDRIEKWFDTLWNYIRRFMEDPKLGIHYERRSYSFLFTRSDGYQFDLNTLADGHAAVFGVLAEILLRIECIQSTKNDFTFEPEGIVIIDEIEAHLHLSLQEQILPLLTTLFPKLQFIVATHSPAVIASIPGAVVYDLKKQIQIPSDEYRGIPYGMLMTGHFGISSDIDLDSTQKLVRLRELAQKSQRSEHEDNEFNQLAQILSDRSSILANEVWMIKEKLSATSIQLAGE